MGKIRLDTLVMEQGAFESREKAKAVIMSGIVYLDDRRVDKPGMLVPEEAELEFRGQTLRYVSRGGLKLEKALKEFSLSPEGKCCIDCGASTGGFTDCLLQNGAAKVYAADVGYGQLDWRLRQDPRVVVMERTNVRHLQKEDIPEELALAVIDVSFISLRLILPAVKTLLRADGEVVCLIKPQFEAGRDNVGKRGVVRDPEIHRAVLEQFLLDARDSGFSVLALSYSPIKGPEGNIEYLAHLSQGERDGDIQIQTVVEAAHGVL